MSAFLECGGLAAAFAAATQQTHQEKSPSRRNPLRAHFL
jgi:hypothetical protein